MRRIKLKNNKKKNTMIKMIIVFFCALIMALLLFNNYAKNSSEKITLIVNEKIDKILYQFFNELITDDIINKENINNILEFTKNSRGEILTVNYDLEKTYKILTDISKVLKKGIDDLENGKINISSYDQYLKSGKYGLIFQVPLFISSSNIFINNLGPKIPIGINFNENLLTNIKTKVKSYGFNNALLEIYVVVEMQKTLITPVKKDNDKLSYDILIGALVINGSVPSIYGTDYEKSSSIFNLPLNQ